MDAAGPAARYILVKYLPGRRLRVEDDPLSRTGVLLAGLIVGHHVPRPACVGVADAVESFAHRLPLIVTSPRESSSDSFLKRTAILNYFGRSAKTGIPRMRKRFEYRRGE